MTYFHESQPLRRQGLIVLAVIAADIVVLTLVVVPGDATAWVVAVALATLIAVTALVLVAMLETTVDGDAITVAFRGLWPTRRILLTEVRRAVALKYRPLFDYGGYGVRLGLRGLAFNVHGDEGVLVEMRSGSRVMIGSQRAHELESAIARAITDREAERR